MKNNKPKKIINLFWPSYNGVEIQREMKKLFPADMSNRWLGQGPKVDEFEREFGKKYGYKFPISVSSGTAALELAYHLIGLKKGDEVITPVLTCTATNIPFLRMGVRIVFADIKPDLTINPDDVLKKITKKTKAIVAVTLGGVPVDKRIFAIGRKHNIPVVIDAAQSLGQAEKDGDYICHSFQAIKHFTTGDGGMLIVRTEENYKRAKKLRWFGIDREAKMRANWQPYVRRQMTMNIQEPGFKYQMHDISAVLGLIGLRHSDKYMVMRKKIADYYDHHLICRTVSGGSYWLYGVLIDGRDAFADYLSEHGIETNLAHLRNDIFKVFGGKRWPLPMMNKLEFQYTYIPLNAKMTMNDAKYVVKMINKFLTR